MGNKWVVDIVTPTGVLTIKTLQIVSVEYDNCVLRVNLENREYFTLDYPTAREAEEAYNVVRTAMQEVA
jgi:hypothetical protein